MKDFDRLGLSMIITSWTRTPMQALYQLYGTGILEQNLRSFGSECDSRNSSWNSLEELPPEVDHDDGVAWLDDVFVSHTV